MLRHLSPSPAGFVCRKSPKCRILKSFITVSISNLYFKKPVSLYNVRHCQAETTLKISLYLSASLSTGERPCRPKELSAKKPNYQPETPCGEAFTLATN
jgi:hypothetical protein